jgi:mRNA interferase MazF
LHSAALLLNQEEIKMRENIKRGDIFFADLNPVRGSEQDGVRPTLVIQNDIGNKFSPTIIITAITSSPEKVKLPTHVPIHAKGLSKNSIALLEQIRTIDKVRLAEYIGHLDGDSMELIDKAIGISFGLDYLEVLQK